MINRDITSELFACAKEYPVVTIFGPRQSGKTTLVQMNFPDKPYYSLEDPDIRLAAEIDPREFLGRMPEGGILDEIQRLPLLLSYIQGIVDKERKSGMFILTGSHQPDLHQAVSQSLAGRTAVLTLLPFSFNELKKYPMEREAFDLITKGAFPRLHENNLKPDRFFNGYLQTYVERDVRALINLKDLGRFQQFLTLLAGRIGQIANYTSLSNDIGVSSTTIKNWISVLKASYIVFELPPFFENIGKRIIKSPKLYFTDTGFAAFLIGIRTAEQTARDPLRGGLYENFIILEILKSHFNKGMRPDMSFFRDSHGNEVDLIIRKRGKLLPLEIKSASTFSADFLKGIERFRALTDNRCLPGVVLYNGKQNYSMKDVRIFDLLQNDEDRESLIG
jgi:hypothetical protein